MEIGNSPRQGGAEIKKLEIEGELCFIIVGVGNAPLHLIRSFASIRFSFALIRVSLRFCALRITSYALLRLRPLSLHLR